MYRRSARDFLGSLLDGARFHPFADAFRFPRLRVAWWHRFRPARYARLERVNLGSGSNPIPGWLNVDVAGPADLRFNFLNRFPLPTASARIVYSEHTLEHFHVDHVRHVLHEAHRILRPGGVLRLSVPLVQVDGGPSPRVWRPDEWDGATAVEWNRRVFGHEHKTVFSFPLLGHLLREAGFSEVVRVAEGSTQWLAGDVAAALEHRRAGNLVVEARRPPSA